MVSLNTNAAQILESISDAFFALDRDWRFSYVNRQAEELLGRSREDLLGKSIWEEYAPALGTEIEQAYRQAMDEATTVSLDAYYEPHARWYEIHAYPSPAGISVYFRNISPRKRSEALLRGQKRILEELISGKSLPELLAGLCQVMEEQGDGLHASVLLLDADGRHLRHGAGPSLPAAYHRAIDGIAIGPEVGSCGTAAYRKETVVVTDLSTDPLWANFRDLALGFGLRACWSSPIMSEREEVLGTFAIYHQQPHNPGPDEREIAAVMAHTAAVAIQWHRAGSQLALATAEAARHQRLLEAIVSTTPDLVYVFDRDHRFRYANPALLAMWGRSWEDANGKNCLELGYEPWHAEMHDRELDHVFSTGQPVRGEVPFHGPQGRRIYDYIFVPVLDARGEVELVAGTTRDITERKEYEESERGAREAAEQAHRELSARTEELRMQQERLQSVTRYLRSATRCAAQIALQEEQVAIARIVVDTLVNQFAGTAAAVWLRGTRNGWLRMVASSGLPSGPVFGLDQEVDIGLNASKIGWVARTGRPFISSDLTQELQLDQAWLTQCRIVAGAYVPIIGREGLHGVLATFATTPLPLEVGEVLATIAGSIATRLDYLEFAGDPPSDHRMQPARRPD